jgi:hypothetical protein
MRYALTFSLLGLAATWLVVACATGEDDAEAPLTPDAAVGPADAATDAPPVDRPTLPTSAFERACTDNATSQCLITDRCNPTALAQAYGTVSACIARVKENCLLVATAPGTGWTPENMTACAAARNVQSCDGFLKSRVPLRECDIRGSIDDEGPCRGGAQCKSGYCKPTPGEGCGFCVPRAPLGAACANNNDCDGELLCSGNKTCTTPVTVGQPCDTNKPCALGLACLAGTCKAQEGEGKPCDRATNGNAECDTAAGLYCKGDVTPNVCARIAAVAATQPCAVPNQEIRCAGSGACVGGVCVAPSPDGTPCGDAGPDVRCGPLALCVDEKCQLPNPTRCR